MEAVRALLLTLVILKRNGEFNGNKILTKTSGFIQISTTDLVSRRLQKPPTFNHGHPYV